MQWYIIIKRKLQSAVSAKIYYCWGSKCKGAKYKGTLSISIQQDKGINLKPMIFLQYSMEVTIVVGNQTFCGYESVHSI